MRNLEQDRRDFKANDPALYAYIGSIESAKALDSAGGDASGARDQYGAANRVWEAASRHVAHATALRMEAAPPELVAELTRGFATPDPNRSQP